MSIDVDVIEENLKKKKLQCAGHSTFLNLFMFMLISIFFEYCITSFENAF
jgi:hypothetical protein